MRIMKRVWSLILALTFALILCVPAFAVDTGFSDVADNAPYAEAAAWCRENGLMDGVGDGRFAPNDTLTRAMLATVLYRAGKEPAVAAEPTFSDVPAGTWYSNAVVWANEKGIVTGYGGGRFGPNDPVSVEQLEVILGRYTGNGPEWVGDPAKAHAATRAEIAAALMANLKSAGEAPGPAPANDGKILVAYFSATGNTKSVAEKIAASLDRADLYEIMPAQPYTAADLNYNTDCRANREQNDDSARPAISGSVEELENYDVIFLGYPIWWGEAPRIISTFLESYDFSGKTIIPFCTSGSSPFGSSDAALRTAAQSAVWMDGRRFSAGASAEEIMEWAGGLAWDTANTGEEENAVMQLKIDETIVSVEWESNESVDALKALCEDRPLKVQMSMYGGFEQVGPIGQSLPRNDVQTTTQAGDIVLYSGNQIVVFYGSNSWAYTRLGRITGQTADDMARLLGNGNVIITISGGSTESGNGSNR